MTWTFSTFGAAPSTNFPRATAVLFTPVAGLRIAPVDQLVLLERRIERDVEQPALSARVNRRQPGDRLRHLLAVGADHAQPSGLLGDEHLAVGQERQPPRIGEPLGHRHDVEGDVELLLRRPRLPGERRLLSLAVRRTRVQPGFGSASWRAAASPAAGRRRLRRVADQAAEPPHKAWNQGRGRLPPRAGSCSSSISVLAAHDAAVGWAGRSAVQTCPLPPDHVTSARHSCKR